MAGPARYPLLDSLRSPADLRELDVAALTALISVNGAVAALLPVAVVASVRLGRPTSQVLMPLVFASHAGSMLALTGTPVENSADDLLGLFEYVAPGQLHDRMSPREMGVACADHVLRRTKDKVLEDLPPRMNC